MNGNLAVNFVGGDGHYYCGLGCSVTDCGAGEAGGRCRNWVAVNGTAEEEERNGRSRKERKKWVILERPLQGQGLTSKGRNTKERNGG